MAVVRRKMLTDPLHHVNAGLLSSTVYDSMVFYCHGYLTTVKTFVSIQFRDNPTIH